MNDQRAAALLAEIQQRTGTTLDDFSAAAVAISGIPYGRPSTPTPEDVVRQWRGTCSTKHILLKATAPGLEVPRLELLHRVYRLSHQEAWERWGPTVAAAVPSSGLVDVHTYAVVDSRHGALTVDVTFPISEWTGTHSLQLACGDGLDYPAGGEPLASKAELVARFCRPDARERLIAALASVYGGP